jgi:hypothetical protein
MTETEKEGAAVTLQLSRDQLSSLLEFDERLRLARGIGILSSEGRVLMHIALNGTPPVTDTMAASGTSYRGFYTVLGRLKKASLVHATVDIGDHRVRRLSIGEEIKHELGQ